LQQPLQIVPPYPLAPANFAAVGLNQAELFSRGFLSRNRRRAICVGERRFRRNPGPASAMQLLSDRHAFKVERKA